MTDSRRICSQSLVAVLALAAALVGGCAFVPDRTPPIPILENHSYEPVEAVDLLRMSPEMSAFVRTHAGLEIGFNRGNSNARAWALAYAALDPYLLDFDYDPMMTLPADQAFEIGRGNCLTFSSLFIAMALYSNCPGSPLRLPGSAAGFGLLLGCLSPV